ncbi:hypothetical protein E4T39_04240 [Aureobasidium subglaciale]|nr:hypothetical protein E4T39_04240 [Aureobasidium subglaciale]
MSSFLLFCISQVPSTIIDVLLQTPRHNFFSLVRDSGQSTLDPLCTPPPVGAFRSDFTDREQIHYFIKTNLHATGSDLEPCQYALLDEHSAANQTVVLAHSYSSLQMRDPESMTEEELKDWDAQCEEHEDDADDSWREWRVEFVDAERLPTILCFEGNFTIKLYDDDFVATHTDTEDGFQLDSAYRAFVGAEYLVQD